MDSLIEALKKRGDDLSREAAEFIDGLLVENADLRAAIKHLGQNPVVFLSRAKRKRERDGTTAKR